MMSRQIVITLPEWTEIKQIDNKQFADLLPAYDEMLNMIKNGKPLPKGHGDLIDKNDLLDRIGLEDNDSNREDNVGEIITLEDIDFIPTIIPADTETWNGIHTQTTAPKGTFERIFNDADDNDI